MLTSQYIRNFVIISHVDHGKSTLADRFLELTKTIPKDKMREQYLDQMELERERGITIKMQPVRMTYALDSKKFILNLIDTPGHIDFSYEVSRALAAVEGAILLVDATKGIQAQTLSNFELAKKQGLIIIPALNKIDLPNVNLEKGLQELADLTNIPKENIIPISAKRGDNVDKILIEVINQIPPPRVTNQAFRALIFDTKYDFFKGVIAYVKVVDGSLRKGDKIYLIAKKTMGTAKEVGYFLPQMTPQNQLNPGEIGYIATGIKDPEKVRVGDTIIIFKDKTENIASLALPGYQEPKSVVFSSLYPQNSNDYDQLKSALYQLNLQDPSFTFETESREFLGRGFRCGFLGTLHMEIIIQRIQEEFKLPLIISSPSVNYVVVDKNHKEYLISSPGDWPDYGDILTTKEPWVTIEILTPNSVFGRVMELLDKFSGKFEETKYFSDKILISYEMPLREMIRDFYGKLKNVSQGYASMSYELSGYKEADLVKLEILIADKKEEPLAQIVSSKEAFTIGKKLVEKLKEIVPPQQFPVALQAQIKGKIIARETIKARRRDVTAPLYGGDFTRKLKLLQKQKRGKKELKEKGKVSLPTEVFLEMAKFQG